MNEGIKKYILYKGIFWIKDIENLYESTISYKILCDKFGNVFYSGEYVNAIGKSGNNFNHKKLWDMLPASITNNITYDYYPRGRVEIKKCKATIFISQYLADCKDEIVKYVCDRYNITKENGINKVLIHIDGSEHYYPKFIVKRRKEQ